MNMNHSLIDGMVSAWFSWMVPMALQVTILAAIIWLVIKVFRNISSEFIALIWILVFVRLVLPPSLSAPWSATELFGDMLPVTSVQFNVAQPDASRTVIADTEATAEGLLVSASTFSNIDWALIATAAFFIWAFVGFGLLAIIAYQYASYWKRIREELSSPETPLQENFEKQLAAMDMDNTILLRQSKMVDTPGVFGVNVPVVLLPHDAEERFEGDSLSDIIAHELAHVRRRDLMIGWATSALACVYWFHPLVWFALIQYRRNRELSCDEMALTATNGDGLGFARTILKVAETSREPIPLSVGFLGILEQSDNLMKRVNVARSDKPRRKLTTPGLVGILAMAALLIPMGPWTVMKAAENENVDDSSAPKVVKTIPMIGAKEVDPAATEIRVVFDRPMQKGFSWTGGGDVFPEIVGKPKWVDSKTCVLTVKLVPSKYYRLGINSSSFKNFRGENGQAAELNAIYFVTKGADETTLAKLTKPNIVKQIPAPGATDVDPTLTEISVVFDTKMGAGFSWVKVNGLFPETNGTASWSDDAKTSSIPVKLQPATTYRFGLNSVYHNNFQSASGIPIVPVVWEFTTKSN